jgi:HTH-type transcriptional regulator / antitoxin MqsA
MICDVCGCDKFRVESVNETFRVEDRVFVVENIPAQVCERCGEAIFAADVAEQVRRLIHGPHQPIRVLSAEVLSYRAA